jgi:mannosyltransferase OCH1-like enzyme
MMKMNKKKIINPGYARNYLVKEYGQLPRVEDAVIPLKLHLFWHDKKLPTLMQKNVELLKKTNPEFEVVVYDNEMAREYIKMNFSDDGDGDGGDVLHAYDTLIPISFKSDLFRFCVVYKEGGVYLDIKFEPINGFKLLHLTKWREVWASEQENIATTIMFMSVPGNPILLRAIDMIKYNVANRRMGREPSSVTGPWLLTDAFLSISGNRKEIFTHPMFKIKAVFKSAEIIDPEMDCNNKIYLTINGSGGQHINKCMLLPIFKFYKGYRMELNNLSPQLHWTKMWEKGAEFVFV